MTHSNIDKIASELGLRPAQVAAVLDLLAEGATVPFIARYRKEKTASLDEVQITDIRDRDKQLKELIARKDTVIASILEQGLLTPDLRRRVEGAATMSELEDIYLPYRPKRRTRATIAKERGLEPLANALLLQAGGSPQQLAAKFVNAAKEVPDVEAALAGARDIIAERVSEDERARAQMRRLFERKGRIITKVLKGKEEEGAKYRDYFQWEENFAKAPSHRVLAMRRAEKERIISMTIAPMEEEALQALDRLFVKGRGPVSEQVESAVKDGYKRLLAPSMETEMRVEGKRRADTEAIKVFAENLRQLLLAAPLGSKRIMALDPGFRTGCKLVLLDGQGRLVLHEVVYPHTGNAQAAQAAHRVRELVRLHNIEAIAIGNGTAGRETERFIKGLDLPKDVPVVLVNESGASIYSASDVAREEFPQEDVTVRGAVSIGRRLMDPLAELVKIDPKSIGVGQYQHDVDQGMLKQSLDDVVESCVNGVGVELNTASKQLLSYVSGLGPALATNIVAFRDQNGPFRRREDLKKVPRLGEKAFQQAAGFLRIRDAAHPLDASAVHPESYGIVDRMAKDLRCSVAELMRSEELRNQLQLERYLSADVGMPTLKDIMKELAKPGRDPRSEFEAVSFREGINEIQDLEEGMILQGVVTNITRFGAFVDIGVHQDGLVHVSEIADRFIRDPAEILKVQQKVSVKVTEVDKQRKRISLSMKGVPQ